MIMPIKIFIFPLTDQNITSIVEEQTELSIFTNTSSRPAERESELYVIPNIRVKPASPVYDLPQSEKYEYPKPPCNTHQYEYPSVEEPASKNENEDLEQKHKEVSVVINSGYTPLVIPLESTDNVYTHLVKVHKEKEDTARIEETDKPVGLLNPTDGADYTPLVRPPVNNESADNAYTNLINVHKEKEDTGTMEEIDRRDGLFDSEEDGDYTPLVRSALNNESRDNGYTHLINVGKENVNIATTEKIDKPDQLVNPEDEDYTPLVRPPLKNNEPPRYQQLIKNNKRSEEPGTSEKTDEPDELSYVDVIDSGNVTIEKKK